jgi:hypothetical protein
MKPHLSDVAKKALEEEGHREKEYPHPSGVKIVINVGGPPMPMMRPMAKPPVIKKKKKLKNKLNGPMESALKSIY